mmetsp:Transcript_278/g.547  ORF Transcript_278/g.547 Transcript_278/m.547 type:complete len:124 (-) Transcript_278:270-641(-)
MDQAQQLRLARRRRLVHKAAVERFLEEHGFTGVNEARRSLLKTTYPLHSAAKHGDHRMILLLLEEGADALQKNSSGKTAEKVAEQRNRGGSHDAVLRALRASAASKTPPTSDTACACGRAGGC